jgi:uroporphyrinogen-III synthase
MSRALEGRTIALAEGRQLEDLAGMLEKEGAVIIRCPMVSILDAPDEAAVLAWLQELIAGRFAYLVLMTGEGLRRLLAVAQRHGLREPMIAALTRTCTVTRGPKPVRALKEIGLAPNRVADPPTTEGVIATLRLEPVRGQTVGVQLYGEPNPVLIEFLESAGAKVSTVLPYVYAAAADAERVVKLIERQAAGQVDVMVFTSSPQVERLYGVATEHGLLELLQQGLAKTRVAAVGPVVAEHLRKLGVRVDICPEQGFVMKNLVALIGRSFVTKNS